MNAPLFNPSRRDVLAGALVVSFSLRAIPSLAQEQENVSKPPLPGSLKKAPMLDAWIRIDADGSVTVFTGKCEIGQGVKTALIQVAAEELELDPHAIHLVTADTARAANEGFTSGSNSMKDSASAIRNAAAQVREILIGIAAERLGVAADRLRAQSGAIIGPDNRRAAYGDLVAGNVLHVTAQPTSKLKAPDTLKIIGQSLPRIDIPGKVTGGVSYVHDLRLSGMVHARVVRPPSYDARLQSIDTSDAEKMPGVIKVVRDGSFLGILAQREFQAVTAMHALAAAAKWDIATKLPDETNISSIIESLPAEDHVIADKHAESAPATRTLRSRVSPSLSDARIDRAVLRRRVIRWRCADRLVARARHVPAAPGDRRDAAPSRGEGALHPHGRGGLLRPQWRRRCGSRCGFAGARFARPAGARAMDARAGASMGALRACHGEPRACVAGRRRQHRRLVVRGAQQYAFDAPAGGGAIDRGAASRNSRSRPARQGPVPSRKAAATATAIPLYALPNVRVVHHFVPDMPLRVSALRGLGAYHNIFAIESFMDELAAAAGADAIEFRLRHLKDKRARAVITAAAERFGWSSWQAAKGKGRGFAFARYKNLAAFCAVAIEVDIEHESGRVRLGRAVAAVDSGAGGQSRRDCQPDPGWHRAIGELDPLRIRALRAETRILSQDWSTYPILRFGTMPESVDVHVIDAPGEPFLGTGEAAQGPTAAAIANAVANATGMRIRDLPLNSARVKAAIGV